MEIPLNIPQGSRQREFIDYLNSALRQRSVSYSGSAGVTDEGLFEVSVTGKFQIDQDSTQLIWRLLKDTAGTLLKLTIESVDHQANELPWSTAVHEFVTSVLAATLAEKQKTFFRRSFFFYIGSQLDGEYWLPGYRFSPAYPEDPNPHLINAERIVSIDQEIEAIDDMHATALAHEGGRRHAARLSLLLNTGLYAPEQTMRWVLPDMQSAAESKRCF